MQRTLPTCVAAVLVLAACQRQAPTPPATPAASATTTTATAATPVTFHDAIYAGDFVEHVSTLSSDELECRGEGTQGVEISVQ
jgi:hypothetical protein